MMDIHKEKLMAKVENMAVTYEKYRLIPLDEIACDMWETDDHTLRSEPGNEAAWRPVHIGDPWGKEYGYAWFRGDLTVPASWEGKALWLLSGADATECLLFLNGEPAGLFDYTEEVSQPLTRPHRIQPLTFRAAAGEPSMWRWRPMRGIRCWAPCRSRISATATISIPIGGIGILRA